MCLLSCLLVSTSKSKSVAILRSRVKTQEGCIRLWSNTPSVSLSDLPGADIKYEPASVATEGVGLQTGDQGHDGLHGLPGRQDQERDGHIGQIGWQVCSCLLKGFWGDKLLPGTSSAACPLVISRSQKLCWLSEWFRGTSYHAFKTIRNNVCKMP